VLTRKVTFVVIDPKSQIVWSWRLAIKRNPGGHYYRNWGYCPVLCINSNVFPSQHCTHRSEFVKPGLKTRGSVFRSESGTIEGI